jgi:hypothetical protein
VRLLRALVARREVLSACVLALALGTAVGWLRALRVVAPEVACELAYRRGTKDPWDGLWRGPPWRETGDSLARYSAGPNGIDESVYFDLDERWPTTFPGPFAVTQSDGSPIDSFGPDTPWVVVRVAADGVTPLTSAQIVEADARRAAETTRLYADLATRSAAGPRGDDVFLRFTEGSWVMWTLSMRPIERWLALGGLALAWLLGARPLAPRHASRAIELWRVLLLASAPAVALTAIVRPIVEALGLHRSTPLLVAPEVATSTSAALACALLATWVRATRPADSDEPGARARPYRTPTRPVILSRARERAHTSSARRARASAPTGVEACQ